MPDYGGELVTLPYVSPSSFKAYPSYAELDNLVTGVITQAPNDAQLNDMLIMSSQWATDQANVPLHAHIKTENKVMRVQRNGSLSWHPAHNPVKTVTALAYNWNGNFGATGSSTAVTDFTGVWIEESAQVNLPFAAMNSTLNGLQFGPVGGWTSPLYTAWTYQAGFTNALLAAPTIATATSLTVTDPTGIVPGDRLRIWEPGVEEAVTVASNYVIGSATVPLVSPMTNAHTTIAGVSALPSSIMLAVVYYTCALLMRPDSRAEDQFPDTRTGVTTRSEDGRKDGTGMIAEAYRQIRSYTRVR
jgi:hypothetical protein